MLRADTWEEARSPARRVYVHTKELTARRLELQVIQCEVMRANPRERKLQRMVVNRSKGSW